MVELLWTASISCLFHVDFGEGISSIIMKSYLLNQNVVGFFVCLVIFFVLVGLFL